MIVLPIQSPALGGVRDVRVLQGRFKPHDDGCHENSESPFSGYSQELLDRSIITGNVLQHMAANEEIKRLAFKGQVLQVNLIINPCHTEIRSRILEAAVAHNTGKARLGSEVNDVVAWSQRAMLHLLVYPVCVQTLPVRGTASAAAVGFMRRHL